MEGRRVEGGGDGEREEGGRRIVAKYIIRITWCQGHYESIRKQKKSGYFSHSWDPSRSPS